jgi:hypothetical protein
MTSNSNEIETIVLAYLAHLARIFSSTRTIYIPLHVNLLDKCDVTPLQLHYFLCNFDPTRLVPPDCTDVALGGD